MLPEEIRDNKNIANFDCQLRPHTNTPRKHGYTYGILDGSDCGAVECGCPRGSYDVQSVERESGSRSEVDDRINMNTGKPLTSDAVYANESGVVANLHTLKDRVSEYEACSRQKLGDGRGKRKNMGGGNSPIARFPNGEYSLLTMWSVGTNRGVFRWNRGFNTHSILPRPCIFICSIARL